MRMMLRRMMMMEDMLLHPQLLCHLLLPHHLHADVAPAAAIPEVDDVEDEDPEMMVLK
jgi:hypothetical protein